MWDVGSYKTSERHAESQASASWQWSEAQETDWKLPNHMRHARKSRKQKITHLKHLAKYHLCVSISCGFARFCFLNGCLRGPSLMLCTRTSLSSPTVTTKWFSSLRSQVLRFCSSTSTVHAQYTSTCPVLVTTPAARPLPSCLHSSAMLKNGNQHAAQSSKLSWVSIPSIQGTICFWASLGVWPQIETIQQRLVLQGVDRQLGPQASTWDQSDWDLKIALKA